MALFSRSPDADAAPVAGLPDAPIALLRLEPDGRVSAANRAALDLLGVPAETLLGAASEAVWGLPLSALVDSEGSWQAPGGDPARRVRYQRDRDRGGQGWLLSLPHPETAALLRDVALLGEGQRRVRPARRCRRWRSGSRRGRWHRRCWIGSASG